jgi:signal transduction histidine kinase
MVFQQISVILTTSPGNLIIHLALIFAVMATMQSVLAMRRFTVPEARTRLIIGLNALLLGQLLLFTSSGLAWQNLVDPHVYLPPLDRAVSAWCLIWIVWLWCFAQNKRLLDGLNYALNLLVILILVYTLREWTQQNYAAHFNGSLYDLVSMGLILVVCLLGLILLAIKRPDGWGIGAGIFVLQAAGAGLQIFFGDLSSDFPAWFRLAQLCSFPLLPSLVQRYAISSAPQFDQMKSNGSSEKGLKAITEPGSNGKSRYTTDPRAIHAWLTLANQHEQESIRFALTHAIAQTMLADLCCLVPISRDGKLHLQNGYDLIRAEELSETTVPSDKVPALMNAIERGRPLRINLDDQVDAELKIVAEALGLEQVGSILSIPLAGPQEVWGSIFLLSPYSERVWSISDQNFLIPIIENILKLLKRNTVGLGDISAEDFILLQGEFDALRQDFDQLQTENHLLTTRLEELDQAGYEKEITSLIAVQKESEELVSRLQEENQQLRQQISAGVENDLSPSSAGQVLQFETELRVSLEEIAHLQNALASANMKILSLEMQARQQYHIDPESNEVIAAAIQELRQPITSIVGYTDLLMSESVGILGALQRKFLERVRSSTERMQSLMDDLITVTTLEGRHVEINTTKVDMTTVIDAAIAATSALIREKEISVRLELPEDLPEMTADQDSLEQIFIHLVQNAAMVSPNDGVIKIRASLTETEKIPYLLTEVTDSGGGIATEDLPKVFWRHYRADSALLQGVGDKGISLSIAKALVEVMGGRIWVDSDLGKSATFSVLLPIASVNGTVKTNLNESVA